MRSLVWIWAGRGSQAPPCLRGQMIPSAHPGLLGAWRGGLALVPRACRPDQAPSVSGLVLDLDPTQDSEWTVGVYGTAPERRLLTGYSDQCHVTATLQSHEERLVQGAVGKAPLTAFPRWET